MKKRINIMMLLMALVMAMTPISARAANAQSPEVVNNGRIIAFDPVVKSFEEQKRSMVVTIDTVSVAYMYEVQWSDRPDFQNAQHRFFRNVDNHGCMIIDTHEVRQKGKTYNVREIWYGGYLLSWRKVEKTKSTDKLVTPQSIVDQLRKRYRIEKRLYVPAKGKYVRVRCCYFSTGWYAYSKWITVR